MLIDNTHRRWIQVCSGLGAASALTYILYSLRAPNGPTGGSAMGLLFGFAGTGLIIFECLLGLRKKCPASPFGRVQTWLKAHVWLGLLALAFILFHAGFRWGQGLASLLMWLFVIITLSGVWGLGMQAYTPRRMTELVTRETLFEQIPEVIRQLRLEADERVEFVIADLGTDESEQELVRAVKAEAGPRRPKAISQIAVDAETAGALRAHYLQEIRPYLTRRPAAYNRRLFRSAAAVSAYFQYLRTIMPVASHDVLRDLEAICEERRQLGVQEILHRWLHGWLYVHAPLSMAFLVLTAIHAVMSLRY